MALPNFQYQKGVSFIIKGNDEDYPGIEIYYNMTELSNQIKFYTAKIFLLIDGKPRCSWNICLIHTKPNFPENFFETYALNVLCTTRLYSILGIKHDGKFL